MPRLPRDYSYTDVYHIIIKGIDEQIIFYTNEDRIFFLESILNSKKNFKYDVYAYCLMSNHVHLVIKADEKNLSKSMQSLNVRYTYYFNKKYGRKGPLVLNRFKSKKVENLKYFLDVCRYVHRNPEKAGIDRTDIYKWSSYHEYILKEKIIEKKTLLHYFNDDINNFIKFTNKAETIEEIENKADFEIEGYLSDEELLNIIKIKLELNSAEDIVAFFKIKENQKQKIKELKNIPGTNRKQISRIIRVEQRRIKKMW